MHPMHPQWTVKTKFNTIDEILHHKNTVTVNKEKEKEILLEKFDMDSQGVPTGIL